MFIKTVRCGCSYFARRSCLSVLRLLIFSFYFSVAQCVAGRRPFTATLPIFMFIYNVCYTLLMALSGDGVVSNNEASVNHIRSLLLFLIVMVA